MRRRLTPLHDKGIGTLLQFSRVKEMGQRAVGWLVERDEARAVLLFANAQLLDVGTTVLGLRSGILHEGNPIAAALLAHSGDLLLAMKLMVGLVVMLIVHRFISPQRRAGTLIAMAGVALVAPAVNVAQLVAGG
jgi:hypothetical protein